MEGSREVVEAYHKVADLMKVRPSIYWLDLFCSAGIGWGAMLLGCRGQGAWPFVLAGLSTLALYRGLLFIHEITHLRRGALPGYRTAWNILIGIPFLVPSFFYVGVHLDHHNPNLYGTRRDPEYHVLVPGSRLGIFLFLIVSALVPTGLFLRFAVLAPLSYVWPWLRQFVIERCSSLVINPDYKRVWPRSAEEQREWRVLDSLATLWCLGHIAALVHGLYPPAYFFYALGILSAVALLNQVRTLVAHRFERHDESLSIEEQLLDSMNFPGPALITELWAPVGMRYHALHHYLPGLPYHALAEAHRRLSQELPPNANYHRVSSGGFWESVGEMLKNLKGKPLVPVRPE